MAYAALISLAKTIDQILKHNPISLPGNQKITSIHEHAILLQKFLEDFQEKAIGFEGQIREVANKAEDVIEYFVLERKSGSINSTGPSKVAKFKRQLRKLEEKMKSIVGEVIEIKNSVKQQLNESPAASSKPRSFHESHFFFPDEDLMLIKDQLCGEPSQLQILPIVGRRGIGKTALAKLVYNDRLIEGHFNIRAWVTVSRDDNAREILLGLLLDYISVPIKKISWHSIKLMARDVYRNLKGKRFLVVMDDMRSKKAWDNLKMAFPDDRNGSRIMVTTREPDVAAYVNSSWPVHEMRLMDEDQSWNLLQHKVFGYGESCPPQLQPIGRRIAISCRGLALAIDIMADNLCTSQKTPESWIEILEYVTSTFSGDDEHFEKLLSWRYSQLPHHLRMCLLYMGGFPEDYEIDASELIKLWVAEGFVKSSQTKTFEEVAEEYLEDLVNRSLVLVNSTKLYGKIGSCSLHDVVRDFCIRQVQQEKFLLPVMDYLPSTTLRRYFLPQILKNQRRVWITLYDLHLKETIYNPPIRTIICTPKRGYRSVGSVQNFPLLRVLHVVQQDDWLDWEPGEVFELIHLRYIAANIPCIPAAISNLQNLQTLIIYRHYVDLPVEIWSLQQLRHLVAFSLRPLPQPEEASFVSTNMQTLSRATNLLFSEMILKMISNVKELEICYSGDKFDQDYHLDNLQLLHRLEHLRLEIRRHFPPQHNLNPVFPTSLKSLTLCGCQLPWREIRIVSSLPNLEKLYLRDLAFQGDTWETTEGEFDQLKVLSVAHSDLEYWVTESSHFPRLSDLYLLRCPELKEIPDGIGDIPTLQFIQVDDQNESLVDSARRIEKVQRELGNNSLRVDVSDW